MFWQIVSYFFIFFVGFSVAMYWFKVPKGQQVYVLVVSTSQGEYAAVLTSLEEANRVHTRMQLYPQLKASMAVATVDRYPEELRKYLWTCTNCGG